MIVSKQGRWYPVIAALLTASLILECFLLNPIAAFAARDARDALVGKQDSLGNRIPDFSNCGCAGGDREISNVSVRIVVKPGGGDDGPRIQAAIDRLAKMPVDQHGFHGSVLLAPGRFEVGGQIRITQSGVVLRGSGAGEGGTRLIATGTDRRALIRVEGVDNCRSDGPTDHKVIDDYVPVGSRNLRVDSIAGLHVGDNMFVIRPSTREWIDAIGMNAFGVAWKPGTRDIHWDRVITRIDKKVIVLDAPITTAIEKRFGGAAVESYNWPGRISNVGIEDLGLESDYATGHRRDEDHAWFGITMNNVENAWVSRVEFRHFAGGAVALWENTKHITVEDCISLEPISELAGYRRQTFFTQGQLTMFLRCYSANGRHDLAVGHCAAGPNAFVNCCAVEAHGSSGPIESWASGVMYDNVRIDGAGLELENRWMVPPGAGWSAANCVLWQCQAGMIRAFRPPTANNWAIGDWGEFAGDASFANRCDFVRPISLYQSQWRSRRGESAAASIGLGLVDPISSTNPTLAEAAQFAAQSAHPGPQLIDLIREQFKSHALTKHEQADTSVTSGDTASRTDVSPSDESKHHEPAAQRLAVRNGWLVVGDELKTGGLRQQSFWRGTIRPGEAAQFGPAITRFVPGREGTGFTDDLIDVADAMVAKSVAVFDHHYGLWYDRRRDDHTKVRRQDGNVVPPFYEQPFARSGEGTAWDGLSKYDLTRFNPWYWNRLHDFAQLCDERGLVLFHENYFQHNILEAAAHWADCPWRPANNINQTGLPEPPLYIGDKRNFMAPVFYDVTNPSLRKLHRAYIRQCLDNFANCSNVIQMTSAEFSGPLNFTQFWIDTIIDWQHEHNRDVLVALSAPKNVQDAILSDPRRAACVDVIDIRYWAYTAGGQLYAPEGGKNLAPRQFLRQTKQQPGGFSAIVKAVREYRMRFPNKAVTYYADMNCPSNRDGWAVLIGGGSLPNVRIPDALARAIPTMAPTDGIVTDGNAWCLANAKGDCLLYTKRIGEPLRLELRGKNSSLRGHWINPETGHVSPADLDVSNHSIGVHAKEHVLWIEATKSD